MKQVLICISQWIIASVVLSWEHIFSLPILFFSLVIIFFGWQPPYYKQVLLLLLSISFATVYQLSFSVSLILFLFITVGYTLLGKWIHIQGIKVALLSIFGCIVVALLTGFHVTGASIIIAVISGSVLILLTKILQLESQSEYEIEDSVWES